MILHELGWRSILASECSFEIGDRDGFGLEGDRVTDSSDDCGPDILAARSWMPVIMCV